MVAMTLLASAPVFDVDVATRAYLGSLSGSARVQSDSYFNYGYWVSLWGLLVAVASDWLLLRFRLASTFRSLGERLFRRPVAVAWLSAVFYVVIGWIITLPWYFYTDFMREHSYRLMDQPFGGWFGEELTALALSVLAIPPLIAAWYALIRQSPRGWWIWASGVFAAFLMGAIVLSPVFIAPLFNTYSELEPGPLRTRIETMAAQYDIPSGHILVFDQSRQDKRISANVSGIGPTIRISMTDNLLERTSDEEVLAVLGHEMGHYKLNHVWLIYWIVVAIFTAGLFLTSRIVPWAIARWGEQWGVRSMADPASMPALGLFLTVFLTATTPFTNSLERTTESQADMFGLEAAREPDGLARVAMRFSNYRKIEPGAVEEFLFYDHPSGATRVRRAMEWKGKNVENPQIVTPPKGYLDAKFSGG